VGLEQKLATELARHLGETAKPVLDKPSKGKPKTVIAKAAPDAGTPDAGTTRALVKAKPPKKLDTKTAADYGRALTALDAHDLETARTELKKVVAKAPDFELASLDLNRLMKQ
jgi:predicted Zn-dependent protease